MSDRTRSILVVAVSMAFGIMFVAVLSRRTDDGAWRPFAWFDLALVHLAAAWPAARCVRFFSLRRDAAWAVVALGAAVAALLIRESCGTFLGGTIQRGLLSLGLMAASVGLADRLNAAFTTAQLVPRPDDARRVRAAVVGLALTTCFVLPALFSLRRIESGLAEVETRVSLGRPVEAVRTATTILVVDPRAMSHGIPLSQAVAQWSDQVRRIRDWLDTTGPESTGAVGLERCRSLAALDEWDAAVRSATALAEDPACALEASLLLGSLYGERQQWAAGRDWYAAACRLTEAAPRVRAARIEALNGVGFAGRNLGDLVAAEAAYRESLEIRPLATTHAQLAGVYDDARNMPRALAHARAAAETEPSRAGAVVALEETARRHRFCTPGRRPAPDEEQATSVAR